MTAYAKHASRVEQSAPAEECASVRLASGGAWGLVKSRAPSCDVGLGLSGDLG